MRTFVILLSLLVFSGCHQHSNFSFFDEHENAYTAYMGSDEAKAKEALITFLGRSTENWEEASKDKRLNPTRVMAIEYLHLAGLYRFEGNIPEFNRAMGNAIRYLDQDPIVSGSPQYRNDKMEAALQLLDEPERVNPPKWRQKASIGKQ